MVTCSEALIERKGALSTSFNPKKIKGPNERQQAFI